METVQTNEIVEEETIKIQLFVKHNDINGQKWDSYNVKMKLVVEGEEEKGVQDKWVTCIFDKEIIKHPEDIFKCSGTLYVKASMVSAPAVYKITKVMKDGKLVDRYPACFIHGYENFEEFHQNATQSMFA